MSNLNIPPEVWLKEQFEYEFCGECGGGDIHHNAIPLLGNWFALCKFSLQDDTGKLQPVIEKFRANVA